MRHRNPPRGVRAQKVIAILEKSGLEAPPQVRSAEEMILALRDYIGKRADEVFIAVYLNVQNHIVGFSEYTMGSSSSVAVDPTGLFRDALLQGAAGIVTAHQHPSGVSRPSDDDEKIWRRLGEAGAILGIPVIDNLVLGEHDAYSEARNAKFSYASLRIMKR